jgi:hypothetical protein
VEGLHFRMMELGDDMSLNVGKWGHIFEDVAALMFFVDLMTFTQEDRKRFDETVNSKWFQSTNVILLLCHTDEFLVAMSNEGLARVKQLFPDYKGERDYDAAVKFIQHKFKKLNRRAGREIYSKDHFWFGFAFF